MDTLIGSLQLDPGAEEERPTSVVREFAAEQLEIFCLSLLDARGVVNVDPVDSAEMYRVHVWGIGSMENTHHMYHSHINFPNCLVS